MRHFTIIILLISTLFASGQTTDKINSAAFKKGNKMDKQEFWKIINFSFDKAQHDKTLQEKLIIDQLSSYTTDQIIEFEIIFRQLVIEADDFKVMAAGKIIEGHVTDDTYLYFRCWLVGQGVGFPFLVQFKNIHNLIVLIMYLTLLGLSVA
ncbi:DUF4240 domain-containing protein [Flectobacillus rivi]|uniref:DUF4240 domain-containing protein n=1 Tax=Flectobacillus rivi TaxID=2984209 RepID=A0ABT6Z8T6_9BACT|nr:DUF4240 domain-containing protein [Flectobacillus rivi]MDI9877345.1 DUF4240 domain-containing protein [Flectobacillus rivi]